MTNKPADLDFPAHPKEFILRKYDIKADDAFWNGLIDQKHFLLWAGWFSLIFRTDVSQEQGGAIFSALRARRFTNKQFLFACDRIEATCRNWPHLKDFIAADKDDD